MISESHASLATVVYGIVAIAELVALVLLLRKGISEEQQEAAALDDLRRRTSELGDLM